MSALSWQPLTSDVPETVLSKVDHVIQMATDGKTTLFKASELLEFTQGAFQYARNLALNEVVLSAQSEEGLSNFDACFHKMMRARLDTNMDSALQCEEDCLRHLGESATCVHWANSLRYLAILLW